MFNDNEYRYRLVKLQLKYAIGLTNWLAEALLFADSYGMSDPRQRSSF